MNKKQCKHKGPKRRINYKDRYTCLNSCGITVTKAVRSQETYNLCIENWRYNECSCPHSYIADVKFNWKKVEKRKKERQERRVCSVSTCNNKVAYNNHFLCDHHYREGGENWVL